MTTFRHAALVLAALSVAACSITGGTLGGRETCWPEEEQRIPSLMKGTLQVGGSNPTLATPEGEVLPLRLPRFDLTTDGSMYVCGVEERGG